MNKILYLLFPICLGCNSKGNGLRHELTDLEVYAVINNLYTSYLDSLNRPYEIYYLPAIFEDSAHVKDQLFALEGNEFTYFEMQQEFAPNHRPRCEKRIWESQKLQGFTIIEQHTADSINLERYTTSDWYNEEHVYYAITRPYRPSSSMRIVMQEYEFNSSPDCSPSRNRSNILFTKGKNGWYLEHYYKD